MRIERTRCLIIFGDITGSTGWARRSTPEDVRALMSLVYQEFISLKRETGLFVKILGDGFMAIHALKATNDHRTVCRIFKRVMRAAERIEKMIEDSAYPRPKGFRIRAVIGPVWMMHFGDNFSEFDVIDYNVDLCAILLNVAKNIRFIASDSVRDAFRRSRDNTIQFVPFEVDPGAVKDEHTGCPILHDPYYMASQKIDREDLKLWIVNMRKKKEPGGSHDRHTKAA